MRENVTGERLIAVFLLGCLLFNYPLLDLFNSDAKVYGIPLLFAYIFAAWMLLIGLMAWIVEVRPDRREH
jgi:predicted permease